MTTPVLVTEGKFDRVLLSWLLAPEMQSGHVGVHDASGKSAAQSLAGSLLLRGRPVVLAVDADAVIPEQVEEQRQYLRYELGRLTRNASLHIELFVPEVEVILFSNRDFLDRLLGVPIADSDCVEAAFRPGAVLKRLIGGQAKADWAAQRLSGLKPDPLRQHPHIEAILTFLRTQ